MPGYDPNRPRPNGGDPFTGLPGDLPVNKPDSETRAPGVNEPDLTVTGAASSQFRLPLRLLPSNLVRSRRVRAFRNLVY